MTLSRIVVVVALLTAHSSRARAQAPTGSIVHMEIENSTLYIADCPNSQLATIPNKLTRPTGGAFESAFGIGDIVSVNGMRVKGASYQTVVSGLKGSPNPVPRGALVDSARLALMQWDLDLQNSDGIQIGTIQMSGLAGGLPPPGIPKEVSGGALNVTGGTGAFFGVRGYFLPTGDPAFPERQTSACEDPALRRVFAAGGGKRHPSLYLIPMTRPEIVVTASGPAVFHGTDFSPVTAANPARAGEVLIAMATGLGPTRPGVDPGQPFPSSPANPLQVVNSPVEVMVNDQSTGVINAVGWPTLVDVYRVDFQVPSGTTAGIAKIQLSAAWISGLSVSIPLQ